MRGRCDGAHGGIEYGFAVTVLAGNCESLRGSGGRFRADVSHVRRLQVNRRPHR
ncbi:hypothetical protein ABH922_000501 [Rhodococcus sp. 27YEA15]|uniref:hypothetical protein n=1 Tax=Rhodococcus sp. 27YEA15 TaxID=3156259 RepID=UPI003C7B8954